MIVCVACFDRDLIGLFAVFPHGLLVRSGGGSEIVFRGQGDASLPVCCIRGLSNSQPQHLWTAWPSKKALRKGIGDVELTFADL